MLAGWFPACCFLGMLGKRKNRCWGRQCVWVCEPDGCLGLLINQEAWGTVQTMSCGGGGRGCAGQLHPECEGARFRAGVQLINHIICAFEGAEAAHCLQLF